MQTPVDFPVLSDTLVSCVRRLGARHWCPATGGNFSARIDDTLRLITQSGRDKSQLDSADLMLCDAAGQALDPACKPSDETALHMRLYALDGKIGAVLHTHSVPVTVLSRITRDPVLRIRGYEMQKALTGQTSHEDTLELPIFDNTQDIPALAEAVAARWSEIRTPALLVRGHGLYAWGHSIAQAHRHIEGIEFLLEALLQERLLGVQP